MSDLNPDARELLIEFPPPGTLEADNAIDWGRLKEELK